MRTELQVCDWMSNLRLGAQVWRRSPTVLEFAIGAAPFLLIQWHQR